MGCLLTIVGIILLFDGCNCNTTEPTNWLYVAIGLICVWLGNKND